MTRVIAIASGGGHLFELKQSISKISVEAIITAKGGPPHASNTAKILYVTDPHDSLLLYFKNFMESLYLFFKLKPDVILSTGAGISVPLCFISKVFRKKLIFIESGARIKGLSKTGLFLYKFSDLFIVQSTTLHSDLPKSKYGRLY